MGIVLSSKMQCGCMMASFLNYLKRTYFVRGKQSSGAPLTIAGQRNFRRLGAHKQHASHNFFAAMLDCTTRVKLFVKAAGVVWCGVRSATSKSVDLLLCTCVIGSITCDLPEVCFLVDTTVGTMCLISRPRADRG